MALRFALAASAGCVYGGYRALSQHNVHCKLDRDAVSNAYGAMAGHHGADTRIAYGVQEDADALHIRDITTKALDHYHQEGVTKGALTYKFQPLRLGEVINLTEETAIFRFLLPNANDEFIMEPCSTLQVMHKGGSNIVEQVQRLYTPITPSGTKGYFDLLVKKQRHGRMTEHLFSMRVGESLQFRMVMHKLKYLPNVYNEIGMIGTGSGITPLLQVIRANVANKEDSTKITLLFANPSNKRVLLKGVLDDLVKQASGKFKAYYTIDRVVDSEPWDGFVGYIDEAMVKKTMPKPDKRNIVLVCGSDQLMNNLCGVPLAVMKPWSSGLAMQPAAGHAGANMSDMVRGVLGNLGYTSEHVYRF